MDQGLPAKKYVSACRSVIPGSKGGSLYHRFVPQDQGLPAKKYVPACRSAISWLKL